MIQEATKTKELTILGKVDENTYTVFKNHDEELVKKIKAVTITEGTFEDLFHGTSKVLSKDGDQYMCIGEDKKKFFLDEEEYQDYTKAHLLNKINNLYPVHKYWNDNFGTRFGDYNIRVVGTNEECDHDDLQKVGYCESEIKIDIERQSVISVSRNDSEWCSLMFCHFNEDGNYVNRDYNIDIKELYKRKSTSTQSLLKKIKAAIPDVAYSYADNKWFTEGFAFEFTDLSIPTQDQDEDDDKSKTLKGFVLDRIEARKNGTYGNRGYKPFKIPKETIKANRDHIMEYITPIVKSLGFAD